MRSWPTTLCPLFLIDGFTFEPISNAIGATPEEGEAMTRLAFTGESDNIAGSIPLDRPEQAHILLDFWRYDLKNGTHPFVWEHPLTLEAVKLLFMTPAGEPAPPRFTTLPGGNWRAALQLRRLPE